MDDDSKLEEEMNMAASRSADGDGSFTSMFKEILHDQMVQGQVSTDRTSDGVMYSGIDFVFRVQARKVGPPPRLGYYDCYYCWYYQLGTLPRHI